MQSIQAPVVGLNVLQDVLASWHIPRASAHCLFPHPLVGIQSPK